MGNDRISDRRKKRHLFRRLLDRLIEIARQKDPPERVALGMALGIFIGMLPIMGIQMVVVSMFALPLRANLKAAVAGVWISNPVTVIPLYYANYRFGLLFMPSRQLSVEEFGALLSATANWSWTEIADSIARVFSLGTDILVPLWVGSAILAVVLGVPTYLVTLRLVASYRRRQQQR